MLPRLKRKAPRSFAERAIGEANKLARAGRHLDAIALLSDANRHERDRSIERRLVELRFEAFRRGAHPPARLSPADTVEDLFTGQLIPEIRGQDLTVQRVRSAIRNHGSLMVRGLVRPHDAVRLKSDIDAAFEAFDARANADTPEHVAGWYEPIEIHHVTDSLRVQKRRNGGLFAVESPPVLFDLIEILTTAGVGDLAREFLGEDPWILARKVTLRRMPHDGSGAWHQDGAFMGKDLRALNIWLALSHCGTDAPSLDVVGRRIDHIVPPGGASKSYAVSAERAEEIGAGAIVRPVFEPGDALVFDHMCLHRTGRDPNATKDRYAIETWLMAPSSYAAMTSRVEEGFQPDDQVPLVF